jgi:formylglycine-generating enzyme required for sulfatase activity
MPAQTVAHQLVSLTERLQLAVAGLTFVGIPAGEFLMGTPKGEEGRLPWEWKPHKVHVPAFEMAITPVTNAQYGRYLAEVKSVEPPKYWGDERYNQPDQPVVGVSWDEAVAYCSWAEAKLSDGSRIRLPSEAEWEYACRAGTKSRFWSGDKDEDLAEVGWFFQNSGRVLHAVAEKRPNPFGLQDMHGNIWEWCLDWMCGEGSKHARAVAAQHPAPCDEKYRSDPHRVIRGGSFADEARFARSAYRVGSHPGDRDTDRGFRPVRVTP